MREYIIVALGVTLALVGITLVVPFASAASLMSQTTAPNNQVGVQDRIQDAVRDHLRTHDSTATSSQYLTMIQDRATIHDRSTSQDRLMNQNCTTLCCQNFDQTQNKLMYQERAGR